MVNLLCLVKIGSLNHLTGIKGLHFNSLLVLGVTGQLFSDADTGFAKNSLKKDGSAQGF